MIARILSAIRRSRADSLPSPNANRAASASDARTYDTLLADRAAAQRRYDMAKAKPRSHAARDAQRRLWAATCDVLDHERQARVVDL